MDCVRLGSTGLEVSRICLGCMSFGEPERGGHPWSLGEDDARVIIRRALEAGVNFFDTANLYSDGSSEEIVEALHDVVRSGKARYLGAPSMYAWQFAKMLRVAEQNGWTRFISMQDNYNLLYREEEREMLPLCRTKALASFPGVRSRAVDSHAIGMTSPNAAVPTSSANGCTANATGRLSTKWLKLPPSAASPERRLPWHGCTASRS